MKQEFIDRFDAKEVLRLNQEEGLNLKKISEIVNIPERRLGELCKLYNLDVKRNFIYKVVDTFFDNIDCEIKAYLLGYFIADGNMQLEAKKRNGVVYSYSYRFAVLNSIDDFEVSNWFKEFITPNKPIKRQNNQQGVKFRKPQNLVTWRSKHMFETLQSYGITPRKTYRPEFELPENLIKSELFPHFIRGLIDGDGYIHYEHNNLIRGGYIQICLNSPLFAQQIIKYFSNYEFVSKFRLVKYKGKTCNWWVLNVRGGTKLIKEYYQKCYINVNAKYYLTRKYHNTEVNLVIAKGTKSPQSIVVE